MTQSRKDRKKSASSRKKDHNERFRGKKTEVAAENRYNIKKKMEWSGLDYAEKARHVHQRKKKG